MNLDVTDFSILKLTKHKKGYTSTQMAKIIFEPKGDYELRRKDALVRKKANKLLKYGFLKRIKENGKSYWNIADTVFEDLTLIIDGKKIKFIGIIVKSDENYVIHGINE